MKKNKRTLFGKIFAFIFAIMTISAMNLTFAVEEELIEEPVPSLVDIPRQVTPLEYNGEFQKPVFKGFVREVMKMYGETEESEVGTYTATFSLRNSNYVWEDGTTDDKDVSWKIDRKIIDVGDIYNDKTEIIKYTGELQRPRMTEYLEDSSYEDFVNITKSYEEKEIGEYETKYSLEDKTKYVWHYYKNGVLVISSEDITQEWEIEKRALAIYDAKQKSLQYTGDVLEIIEEYSEYAGNLINASGDKAKNAGKYVATFTLKEPTKTCWQLQPGQSYLNGDDTTIAIEWQITNNNIKIPKQKSVPKANEKTQKVILENFDESIMNITGDQAKNAGTYTAKVSFKWPTLCTWEDGTSGEKNITWKIDPAPTTTGGGRRRRWWRRF